MGDALCGPSNALQNFQKHTAVDRTLQQDRLISKQSPSTGFRSPNFQQGSFDPEFEAFESNQPASSIRDIQDAKPFGYATAHDALPNRAEALDWAADFQNLRVSDLSHHPSNHQSLIGVPALEGARSNWHHEFMQKAPQQHHPVFTSGLQSSLAPNYHLEHPTMNNVEFQPRTLIDDDLTTETFDEAAFEAAFEQARADVEAETTSVSEEVSSLVHPFLERAGGEADVHEKIRIGSDTIPPADKAVKDVSRDHDELARTAGHLLERVGHDQSQKFRDSNFLALMRRIRDREVRIEGDEFREVSTIP